MTDARIQELQGLCDREGMSPGPLRIEEHPDGSDYLVLVYDANGFRVSGDMDRADAEFFVSARAALPEALAAVRELTERVERLRALVADVRRVCDCHADPDINARISRELSR